MCKYQTQIVYVWVAFLAHTLLIAYISDEKRYIMNERRLNAKGILAGMCVCVGKNNQVS